MVLTTGAAWPAEGQLGAHVQELLDAGAVALVLELGTRFSKAPDAVVMACRERDTPLVVLHQEVQFVAVTEAAHRLLVSSQMAALEARDAVLALFSDLNRVGAPPEHIVAEVAQLLRSPVVLEDLAHRVVWCAAHDETEADVLHDWTRKSRVGLTHEGSVRVAEVAARGRRWGRLVATRVDPETPSPAVDLVLTQGALALSLGAMAAAIGGGTSWDALRQHRVLGVLTGRRFSSAGHLLALLGSAGVPTTSPVLGFAWTMGREGGTDVVDWIERVQETAPRVAGPLRIGLVCAPEPAIPGGVIALMALPRDSSDHEQLVQDFISGLRASLVALDVAAAGSVVATGQDTEGLLASLRQARELLESARPGTPGLLRARGTEMDALTRALPSTRLHEFVEEMIGPVLTYDARHGTDLLTILETYLRHPGNRTHAARESHLSRSVFYQRLELLEAQLGRNLHDGNTLAALHLAVSAHRRTLH